MNKLFILNIFILISFSILADEIEILSDTPGSGAEIKIHYKIKVHYIGTFEDGSVFDSSYKRSKPLEFQIGLRQVIPGWEIGLEGMRVGGKRVIKVPPSLAYGESGVGNLIPPNTTLIFGIEIISIEPPAYGEINVENLMSLQKNGFIIIDIRTQEKWDETGIINGSHQITAFDILGNLNPNFIKIFHSIVMENDHVVFISDTGEISAILANGFVENLGIKNVYSLQGGIQGWIDKYNKVVLKKITKQDLSDFLRN